MTLSELSNLRKELQGLPDGCDKVKYASIVAIISNVENATNIHISEDERNALTRELYNLNESIDQIKKRADNVKRAEHYGRIGFNLWLSADRIFTGEEINQEVNNRIERRKREYLKLNPNATDKKLAKEGLIHSPLIECEYCKKPRQTFGVCEYCEK
jgi:hypothetical protein